jgi:hypothetical protein
MYPKLKINVYFIFLNIGDLTFGITLVYRQAQLNPVYYYQKKFETNITICCGG